MTHPYGEAHKRARAAALAALREGEDMCPFCRRPMLAAQRLDYDHALPVSQGGADGPRRLSHASCNRAAGARLGNRSRARGGRCWCGSNCHVHVPAEEM